MVKFLILIILLTTAGCANIPVKHSARVCGNANLIQVEGTDKYWYVSYCLDGPLYHLETEEYYGEVLD